jgi:ABC-type xylose transport system permease subunit
MNKVVWTFGLIAGVIMAGMVIVMLPFHDQIDGSTGMLIGYTSMVMASLMIYFGVRQHRDSLPGGEIRFWPAVKVALLISAVAVGVYVVSWEIIFYGFQPDFMDKYAAAAIEKMRLAGATEAVLAAETEKMAKFAEMYKNPLVNIAFTALEPSPVVLLCSFVSAGVLSRKAKSAA